MKTKRYNVYDARMKPDGTGWVVDGERGYSTYPLAITKEEAKQLYAAGKDDVPEKTMKPCPVCGHVFSGNKYGGTTEMCPSCFSKLKAAMKKEDKADGSIS